MELSEFLKQNPKFAIGFSGGVDSAYLLYEAAKNGCDVKAYFVKSCFQPEFEMADVKQFESEYGIKLEILYENPLEDPRVSKNPANRCYYCKQNVFGAIKKAALRDGYQLLFDGTNASDDVSDRPGVKALAELSVRSPLRECGLTKAEIRKRSKEAGLFTFDKPSYSCLATRIPVGTEITKAELDKVEGGETILFAMGYSGFRLRNWGTIGKLELPDALIEKAAAERAELSRRLAPYFKEVVIDLKGRSVE